MAEPTVYKFPKKSLPKNTPSERDQHLWEKHQEEKAKKKPPLSGKRKS